MALLADDTASKRSCIRGSGRISASNGDCEEVGERTTDGL